MSSKLSIRHVLTGSTISCIEWYEYAVYGYFAPVIGSVFFSNDMDKSTSAIYSFAVLAIGFFFRPLGSIFFGALGDTKGRKFALITSLIMLGVPSLTLAFLPGYNEIGPIASISLILIRILQGFAIAGNYGGSFIFLIENSPKSRRGFASSCAALGVLSGLLLGSSSAALISSLSTEEFLHQWGWRIPYMLSIFTLILAVYFSKTISETENNSGLKQNKASYPFIQILTKHRTCVLKAMGIISIDAVGIYTFFVFTPHYLEMFCGVEKSTALSINTLGMLLLIILIPIFGLLSDRIDPKLIIKYISVALITLSYPIFFALNTSNIILIITSQLTASIIMAACYAAVPITVVSIFPKNIRYTGTAISFNLCLALFGGTVPFLLTYSINQFNNNYIPVFYLMIVGFISLISIFNTKAHNFWNRT